MTKADENGKVILEDAASYLKRMGLQGHHITTRKLVTNPIDGANGHTEGRAVIGADGMNGTTDTDSDTNSDKVATADVAKPKVFVLSANNQEGVKRNAQQLQAYLSTKSGEDIATTGLLDSLAYTLASKRTAMPWKSFAVAADVAGLTASLDALPPVVRSSTAAGAAAGAAASATMRVALAFTGQGAQWYAMGRGLTVYDPYRRSMAASQAVLGALGCPWDLATELGRSEAESQLRRTEYSQPACTALQVALVDLLRAWGVAPVAVVGHSSGEIAAAYAAGFLTHDAAIRIAWLRGQVSASVAQNGGMLAVDAEHPRDARALPPPAQARRPPRPVRGHHQAHLQRLHHGPAARLVARRGRRPPRRAPARRARVARRPAQGRLFGRRHGRAWRPRGLEEACLAHRLHQAPDSPCRRPDQGPGRGHRGAHGNACLH